MAYLIAVGGGSGSGKTFLAQHLQEKLGAKASILSYDCYYRDQSALSFQERTLVNYDDPKVLDEELFSHHLKAIKAGKSIEVPQYDFATHTRKKETILFTPTPIVIIEGIMVYAIANCGDFYDFRVYVDAESDIRLARRILRDEKERGRTGESVIRQYLATVRPMHKKYVEPAKAKADFVFPNDSNEGIDEKRMDELLKKIESLSLKED
jgi:uridine kinase